MTLRASLRRELESPNLSADRRAILCCELAKQLEYKGEYEEARKALLTQRELVIVQGVIAGHSSKEIAEHLHISVRTVDNHKARVYSKLNINSSLALARLFVGLIKPGTDWRSCEGKSDYVLAKG